MIENPYKSPEAEILRADMIASEVAQIWRDGKDVVLNPIAASFPLRCIKSNEPVSVLHPIKVNWIEASLFAKLMLGLLLANALYGKTITLQVGLSNRFQSRQRIIARTGWFLLGFGLLGLVCTSIFYVATATDLPSLKSADTSGSTLTAVSFISIVACVPLVIYGNGSIFRVTTSGRGMIWIAGAGEAFLASLPTWPYGR